MDIFALRDQLIGDYASYIQSFIHIADEHIRAHVERELRTGLLWPDPLLQLSPSFAPGPFVDDLVQAGTLHPHCGPIFRFKRDDGSEKPLRLHFHQAEAIAAAQTGKSYVLTTGTGSGKSLAYIIPIVDHVLRRGTGRGIQAIVVYPMNALANSQCGELDKFLNRGFPPGQPPVRFARYTGQDQENEREEILRNPPDILLTNYVMLEMLLTRPQERRIVQAAQGLRFLVLDELHTYRGRQGADVALLVRRVREACGNPDLQCVGTSATLAGSGGVEEQRQQTASFAARLFGATVPATNIIGETLQRVTPDVDFEDPVTRAALSARLLDPARKPGADYATFVADPLAAWIETTFGLQKDAKTGRLQRARPISLTGRAGAALLLARLTQADERHCMRAIQEMLLAAYNVPHPVTGFPVFAFRLHQFISRGDMVYASLEEADQRYITTQAQQYVPGDRGRALLPLVFCRECGQEYYLVRRMAGDGEPGSLVVPRDLTDLSGDVAAQPGFLYRSTAHPWPDNEAGLIERLPEDWLEQAGQVRRIRRDRKPRLPQALHLDPLGRITEGGLEWHFVPAPFPFCLNCGVAYGMRQRSDIGKLASLDAGGRSTATTVLSLACIRALGRDETVQAHARKLLSFTDNRQDASLQAGHFNDFVEVGLLRAAVRRAVQDAGEEGLTHDQLPQRVFAALDMPFELYASQPDVRFLARTETERALREVLAYRLYQDLRRGWRISAPNLEQCDLLRVEYASLRDLCHAEEVWHERHAALAGATAQERERVARVLLSYLRRGLAIKVDYLRADYQERLRQNSSQRLREPWAIDENEPMVTAAIAFPRSSRDHDFGGNLYVSGRGVFGQYLRRAGTLAGITGRISSEETEAIIRDLFAALSVAGLVERVIEAQGEGEVPGYQMPAAALIWKAGTGEHAFHDPLTMPRASEAGLRTNAYFVAFYRQAAAALRGIRAREHTAQVSNEERIQREDEFRRGTLPVLYCSPTMELGIDIAELSAVNLRNVPPTPANYAQRSGRAGRSGQPALVFAYCTIGSPHDQYFYRRPDRMVGGEVALPRLDMANEALVRAHVHAVWLAETGAWLGHSLKDVLQVSGSPPTLALVTDLQQKTADPGARRRAAQRLSRILETIQADLAQADWFGDDWLSHTLERAAEGLDRACDRWRGLYRAALKQQAAQNAIITDASRSERDKVQARRLRAEAESQLSLLTGDGPVRTYQSDFYSYRYFASEGFLPGYSFPRLPLSAYIPARRQRADARDEFLSRPRFLAISEFGPRSIIYHEGSRYVVHKAILPVDDDLLTSRAKRCDACGYLHPLPGEAPGPDLCEHCRCSLQPAMVSLFRMQNVSTKRRDRISCDEEERLRQGYEMVTGVRFADYGDRPGRRVATVRTASGDALFRLTYGDAATLWRINLGWSRRRDRAVQGFLLDVERGYWASNKDAEEEENEDPLSPRTERVIPYVEDRRNALLIEPAEPLPRAVMASLQPALKTAIQVTYQLEESELAAEPLPSTDDRRVILFYESAEGGAGVLRQLVADTQALPRIAVEALAICHYDPTTGEDLRRAPQSSEDCEAACYDCLMSYSNQPDHRLLDRHQVRDLLQRLASAVVEASPTPLERSRHLGVLLAACESELERHWLELLDRHGLRLPDAAQETIAHVFTRPDFLYREHYVAVYIDGPDHDPPEAAAHDAELDRTLADRGYTVLRFGYRQRDRWLETCRRHPYVFGTPVGGVATHGDR